MSEKADKEVLILNALKLAGYIAVPQFQFLEDRKFRFDVAMPNEKIAIEYEGGVYMHGAHTRPLRFIRDTVKYNRAAIDGWSVLRYTAKDTKKKNWQYGVVADVEQLINNRG